MKSMHTPKPLLELILTQYEDGNADCRFLGHRGPVAPQAISHLLITMLQQLNPTTGQPPAVAPFPPA